MLGLVTGTQRNFAEVFRCFLKGGETEVGIP